MATNTGTTVEAVNSTCKSLETSPSARQAGSKIYGGGRSSGGGGSAKKEKPAKAGKMSGKDY